MKTVKRYKFLRSYRGKTFKSDNGDQKWKIGEWVKLDVSKKPLDLCNWGLHCSKTAYDAFSYVQGEVLTEVECRGEHLSGDNKECWEEQRVVRAFKWEKKHSVELAIFSAELCIANFEKALPNDKRPREAIEVTKRWLKNPTAKNASAARSAARSAAWSAESAESAESATRSATRSAAWSATRSAESAASAAWSAESAASAAWSAESAAWSAAWSATRSAARSAARSAESATRSAESAASAAWSAESAAIKKITQKFSLIVKGLKEIK